MVAAVFLGLPLCSLVPDGDSEEQEAQQAEPAELTPDADTTAPIVVSGPLPTSFEVDDEPGVLVGYATGPLGVRATWSVASSLEDAAAAVLTGYESQDGVELHYSGYLDLLGNTWACLVAGPSWVEVAVVEDGGAQGDAVGAHSQEGPCELSVMRLGQQAIEEGQEQDVGEVGG